MDSNKEEFVKRLKLRDRAVNLMDKDKIFRIAAIKNSLSARTAQEKHNLPLIPAYFLARQLAAASLTSSFLKGEERIVLESESDGPVSKIYAESNQVGECRGFTVFNDKIGDMNFSDLSGAQGNGVFKVSKVLYNKSEPVTGIVELIKGDIAASLAYYFSQSEQTPSAVVLDADFDDNGIIKQSGGFIIQAMPGAKEKDIQKIYDAISNLKSFTNYLENDYTPDKIIKEILPFELDVIKSKQIDFFCRCSKESFIKRLMTFGADELKDMREMGHNELTCQYCNSRYIINSSDFDSMIQDLLIKNN